MGRATKWLKGLFGMNKESSSSCFNDKGNKKTSSISNSLRRLSSNKRSTPPNISPACPKMMSNLYNNYDKEYKEQVMVVAAATAAVAEAAIEAAEAAVELVRVSSQGRGAMLNCSREVFAAAMTIQTIFRGYLARKALRALKALVKVQAIVRGFLIRKQAYAALHSMEVLIRAQHSVRAQMSRGAMLKHHQQNYPPQCLQRKSQEKFGDSRNIFKVASDNKGNYIPLEPNVTNFDQCIKVVKVDSEKKSRSRRIKKCMIGSNLDEVYSYATSPPPPSRNLAHETLLEGRSFRESDQCDYRMKERSFHESDQYGYRMEGRSFREFDQYGYRRRGGNKYSSTQVSPVFTNSCRSSNAPIKQAKCEHEDVYFGKENENYYPNYMVNTQSSNAKMRSQSVPKQRANESSGSMILRRSLNELIMETKSYKNGAKMQTSLLTSHNLKETSPSRIISA